MKTPPDESEIEQIRASALAFYESVIADAETPERLKALARESVFKLLLRNPVTESSIRHGMKYSTTMTPDQVVRFREAIEKFKSKL